jgi:hypothetical protein
MQLKIIDGKGKTIILECNQKDKLSTVLSNYEKKFKEENPNIEIRRITLTFCGDIFTNEDYQLSLEELGIEDGHLISSSVLYNGGLI